MRKRIVLVSGTVVCCLCLVLSIAASASAHTTQKTRAMGSTPCSQVQNPANCNGENPYPDCWPKNLQTTNDTTLATDYQIPHSPLQPQKIDVPFKVGTTDYTGELVLWYSPQCKTNWAAFQTLNNPPSSLSVTLTTEVCKLAGQDDPTPTALQSNLAGPLAVSTCEWSKSYSNLPFSWSTMVFAPNDPVQAVVIIGTPGNNTTDEAANNGYKVVATQWWA